MRNILIQGNPVNGFCFTGPFDSPSKARNYSDNNGVSAVVANLVAPDLDECPPSGIDLAYFAFGVYSQISKEDFKLPPWAEGQLDFVDACMRHARLLTLTKVQLLELNTVFAYDVAEPFGQYVASFLSTRDKDSEWIYPELVEDARKLISEATHA